MQPPVPPRTSAQAPCVDDRIARDLALTLKWFPVTDSSRVVVWFTRHHGRLSTLIKGAQRPKSWTLGQYDHFYTCELLFYRRSSDDLHVFKECAPLKRRGGLRQNWRGCAAASHIADLLYRVSPPLAASPPLFDLTSQVLDCLAEGENTPALLFWYELQLLRELGLAPDLSAGKPGEAHFAYEEGRVVPNLAPTSPPGSAQRSDKGGRISGGVLALMRRLLEIRSPLELQRLRLMPVQVQEIAAHLDRFSAWHLDLPLPSRNLALDLMTRVN